MKKKITLLLLAILCRYCAIAQTDTIIYLSILDPTVLTSVQQNMDGTVTPVFNVDGINTIVSNYTFKTFAQAYPNSRFLWVRQVYKVIANSTEVATDFTGGFPLVFPYFELSGPAQPISTPYYPADFNSWFHPCPTCIWQNYCWYLDFIHAAEAWDTTNGGSHGDTSVVIGVTDTWFDIDNPDWPGRIAMSEITSDTDEHGTTVAGRIACNTNNVDSFGNPIGYAAIGFNCRLHLLTDMTDGGMFNLPINYGRKILNGSWYDLSFSTTLNLQSKVIQQGTYNEIYENGTTTVFAAGNGTAAGGPPPWYYEYPSSLWHNISVTNVMGENCGDIGNPTPDPTTCMVHAYGSDTTATNQHNDRVAICAPGRRTGGLDFNGLDSINNSSRYYNHDNNGGGGTSFCAPLVSGTLGLMLSANPCLSPYQLEYALKWGSNDTIYDVPANTYLAGTSRWTGRMGTGMLDAGAAVMLANPTVGGLDCNDPGTQTFFIDGIELHTICAPGYATNGIKPQFFPIMYNGAAPYQYLWQALPGNTTALDNPNIANPTIDSSWGTNLAYYMLTVFDASIPQKIANRDIHIQLTTDSSYILGMRDSYVDMLDQANSQGTIDTLEWLNIFSSPDIWNRQYDDHDTIPQVVQYFLGAIPTICKYECVM